MKMVRFVSILIYVSVALFVAASDFQALKLKADRFFNDREWASASAMYSLMLDERPADRSLYGRAIVASEARNDSASVVALMNKAIKYGVPFDSVFDGVRRESFSIGKANLFEQFLLQVKANHGWMSRSVDNSLMNYYAFRHNGPMMVRYSSIMLEGLPDNTAFMKILAQGYLLEGKNDDAIAVYRRILDISGNDYDALLYLGNYYNILSAENRSNDEYRANALAYLGKAYELKPTPYVKQLLDKLK